MPATRRTKFALLALALLCGLLTWRASQRLAGRPELATEPDRSVLVPAPGAQRPAPVMVDRAMAIPAAQKWVKLAALVPGQTPRFADAKFTNRFRNTEASMGALVRNDRALLLRNALVDTASGEPLALPAGLRSEGDPGAYLVQADGLTTDTFRRVLKEAGLEIVSYIPNNAYLVRGSRAAADRVATADEVAAVLPYEPAFKLEPELLNEVLALSPRAGERKLILTVPDPTSTMPALLALGVKEEFRERGPFGTLITVVAPADALGPLAGLGGVQMVERWSPRAVANDLTGPKLGSTTNVLNTSNYFGLTGDGVLVNINDTGVDDSHPDLKGRVTTLDPLKATVLRDFDGHGTHVAGTIAGDGSASGSIASTPQGSETNASFQGKAPKARLFVLPVDLISGPPSGDIYLQEEAAKAPGRATRNRPLISNNSWGYRTREYTTHSASYDAAVRDALPRESGSQPILYVFSAGNEGVGGDSGVGGIPDSIASPGNAKNVITVGALESPRKLTNAIVYDTNGIAVKIGSREFPDRGYNSTNRNYFTNEVLREYSDTDYQVAGFSSRGNVGVDIEGASGRFKPDVVAPGSFILSARSAAWRIENQFLPDSDSFYLFEELERGNEPNYRYESGTSMSAPAISGLLAQMQEFFEQKQSLFPSAAAYKALLINSSLATSETYEPDTREVFNYGGWGQPNLPRSLRSGFTGTAGDKEIAYVGSDVGLGTGEVGRFRVNLKEAGTNVPLRLTLVWTDPPGNPVASAKLVNDLDLIVSNTVSGEVFFGNDFTPGTGFSRAQTTNQPVGADRINNVERVVLKNPLATEYVVLVVGHRVNVNARWDHPTQIAQDFSLAIASDVPEGESAGALKDFEVVNAVSLGFPSPSALISVTNGVAMFNLRAGANSPLIGGSSGTTNQWRFFIFTNLAGTTTNGDLIRTNGSNVAFVIFPSDPVANLSRIRTNGPDLDLYVSREAGLLTLDPTALLGARKSTSQGGTELIALTNQPLGADVIFYVGVKSEDQQGGEFAFFGVSTDQPFTTIDEDGFPHAFATQIRPLTDGSPDRPGIGQWIAISLITQELRRVTPTVSTRHENFPDLLGQLRLGSTFSVLNNHGPLLEQNGNTNGVSVLYDDSGSGDFLSATNSRPTDGPGALGEFMGVSGGGPWFLTTVDNALGNTGSITGFDLRLMPNDFGPQFVERCVRARLIELEVFNVPVDANRLTITITNRQGETLGGPLEVYIRRDAIPDILNPTNNDKFATVFPPNGGDIVLSLRDVPPLTPGRYFVAVYNPNNFEICYRIRARLERGLDGSLTKVFNSGKLGLPLKDGALTESSVAVTDPRAVTAIGVGLRIDHPRISDLEVRLVNPQGDRTVLVENRGRTNATALGTELVTTNGDFSHVAFTFDRASGRSLIYVNGRLVADQVFEGLLPVTTNAMLFATDGFRRNGAPLALDDFGLWKRVLTSDNVRDLYRYGVEDRRGKVEDDSEAGLLAWWPFDGVGTEVLRDFTVDYLLAGATAVNGQVGQALEFGAGQIGFIEPLPELDVMRNTGFTLEGWVKANTNFPTIIAGWARTNGVPAPLLVANFPPPIGKGPGSFSVVYTNLSALETNASTLAVISDGGLVTPGAKVTNTVYAVFTELTNVTSELIKFAIPPFVTDTRTRVLASSTFDIAQPPGDDFYGVGEVVDGWTVASNVVQWIVDGEKALTGNSFIEMFPNLGGGTGSRIRRTFATTPGRFYTLRVGYRRAAFAAGPPSEVDVFADGVNISSFQGTDIWQTNAALVQATGNRIVFDIANGAGEVSPSRQATARANIDAVGRVTSIEVIEPGAGYTTPPRVRINPFFGRGRLFAGVVTLANGSVASVAVTNPGTNYTVGAQVVIGAPPTKPRPAETYLDEIRLIEEPKGLYIPEEPLRPLAKGPALGDWRLEITDGRSGEVGELLSWQMQLTFAPTNPVAYRLTGGVPFTTNVVGDALTYFIVDVPPETTITTNRLVSLTGGPLNLLFSQTGLPDGLQVEDYYLLAGVQAAPQFALLYTNVLPPFKPGQRYYLGVQNAIAGQLNAFTIQVDFGLPLRALTNNIPVAATNANRGLFDYYSFNVSPDALGVRFSVSNLSGDVNLVASKAPGLPTRTVYAYASTNSGRASESIQIDPFSQPVPLEPGLWYLGVYPSDAANRTNPITYTINASELTGTALPLTNGVPFSATNRVVGQIDYYYLDITNEVATATFSVTNMTGNVDLFIRQGLPLPAAASFDFASTNLGLANEVIILQGSRVPQLLTPGRWFLAVMAVDPVPVSHTVVAGYTLPNSNVELLVDSVPQTSIVEAGPTNRLYRFDVPLDSTSKLLFEIYGLDGDADLFIARGSPPDSVPDFIANLKPARQNEMIVVTDAQFPQLGGQWYLDVRFPTTNQVNYTIRAATRQNGILESGIPIVTTYNLPTAAGQTPFMIWNAVPGETYQVQYTESLDNTPVVWLPATPPASVASEIGVALIPFVDSDTFPTYYYRVIQIPSP